MSQQNEEAPRPKSPWTPSYSVSRQGSPAPPSEEIPPKNEDEPSTVEAEPVTEQRTQTSAADHEVLDTNPADSKLEGFAASASGSEQITENQLDVAQETSLTSQQPDAPVESSKPHHSTDAREPSANVTDEPPTVVTPLVEVSESPEESNQGERHVSDVASDSPSSKVILFGRWFSLNLILFYSVAGYERS